MLKKQVNKQKKKQQQLQNWLNNKKVVSINVTWCTNSEHELFQIVLAKVLIFEVLFSQISFNLYFFLLYILLYCPFYGQTTAVLLTINHTGSRISRQTLSLLSFLFMIV